MAANFSSESEEEFNGFTGEEVRRRLEASQYFLQDHESDISADDQSSVRSPRRDMQTKKFRMAQLHKQ